MMVNKVNANVSGLIPAPSKKSPESPQGVSFQNTLKESIREIDELQKEVKEKTEAFVNGELTDIHEVMIAAEKARIGLELMLEIRNKLLEAYQEIMRMQI